MMKEKKNKRESGGVRGEEASEGGEEERKERWKEGKKEKKTNKLWEQMEGYLRMMTGIRKLKMFTINIRNSFQLPYYLYFKCMLRKM